jgi:hypothetical protein
MPGASALPSLVAVEISKDVLPLPAPVLEDSRCRREPAPGLNRGRADREAAGIYRSDYYSRVLVTRVGTLQLGVPQDRMGRFSTELFDCYQLSGKDES